ncbi:hypothetical protein EDB89DRAFT_1905975 [Lactarius sanguifluus]|nr:hypothetical protein EDB89DRAFT_1905975 [Lactarius sanguifluus]
MTVTTSHVSRIEGPRRPPRRELCGAERADLPRTQQDGSVFELQSPIPTKIDFCRLFIREGLLDLLSNVMASRGEAAADMKRKTIPIPLVVCQVSQSYVRNAFGARKVVRPCELLEPEYMLKLKGQAIKHLSMNAVLLEVLQSVNAIEILTRILDQRSSGPLSTEIISSRRAMVQCGKRPLLLNSGGIGRRKIQIPHGFEESGSNYMIEKHVFGVSNVV